MEIIKQKHENGNDGWDIEIDHESSGKILITQGLDTIIVLSENKAPFISALFKGMVNELPGENEIREQFEISESSAQDPYMVAKERHQIEGAEWMRSEADRVIAVKDARINELASICTEQHKEIEELKEKLFKGRG